jgi:hypothetical protein
LRMGGSARDALRVCSVRKQSEMECNCSIPLEWVGSILVGTNSWNDYNLIQLTSFICMVRLSLTSVVYLYHDIIIKLAAFCLYFSTIKH